MLFSKATGWCAFKVCRHFVSEMNDDNCDLNTRSVLVVNNSILTFHRDVTIPSLWDSPLISLATYLMENFINYFQNYSLRDEKFFRFRN